MTIAKRRRALIAQSGVDKHGTWEDLFAHIVIGDYATKYAVGETLPFIIGNYDYEAQIVGFDKDTISDSTDKVPITFVCKYLYITSKQFNPALSGTTEGTGTIGGWEKCELRTFMSDTLFPLIPNEISDRIVSVKKYSKGFNTSATAVNNVLTNDKIWIPSLHESASTGGGETLGTGVYPFFNYGNGTAATNRVKTKPNSNTAIKWHTRTAYSASEIYHAGVDGKLNGAAKSQNAYGVAIGFCIA